MTGPGAAFGAGPDPGFAGGGFTGPALGCAGGGCRGGTPAGRPRPGIGLVCPGEACGGPPAGFAGPGADFAAPPADLAGETGTGVVGMLAVFAGPVFLPGVGRGSPRAALGTPGAPLFVVTRHLRRRHLSEPRYRYPHYSEEVTPVSKTVSSFPSSFLIGALFSRPPPAESSFVSESSPSASAFRATATMASPLSGLAN
ncbi:hypothetical protein SAMN05421595_2934 [Austwickia chelonae]|nr:hypothetical protein SAMN05421595_2934 [Austwickia chelonae]